MASRRRNIQTSLSHVYIFCELLYLEYDYMTVYDILILSTDGLVGVRRGHFSPNYVSLTARTYRSALG